MIDLLDALSVFVLVSLAVGAWLRDHQQAAARVETPPFLLGPSRFNEGKRI
jgi:hypothetical protein